MQYPEHIMEARAKGGYHDAGIHVLVLDTIEITKLHWQAPETIRLNFKSDEGKSIRESICCESAPDVWERWGKWLGVSGSSESIKKYMTQYETAAKLIGTRLKAQCEGESYQGKEFLSSIRDVLSEDK